MPSPAQITQLAEGRDINPGRCIYVSPLAMIYRCGCLACPERLVVHAAPSAANYHLRKAGWGKTGTRGRAARWWCPGHFADAQEEK